MTFIKFRNFLFLLAFTLTACGGGGGSASYGHGIPKPGPSTVIEPSSADLPDCPKLKPNVLQFTDCALEFKQTVPSTRKGLGVSDEFDLSLKMYGGGKFILEVRGLTCIGQNPCFHTEDYFEAGWVSQPAGVFSLKYENDLIATLTLSNDSNERAAVLQVYDEQLKARGVPESIRLNAPLCAKEGQ
jgi:hypothetical protein